MDMNDNIRPGLDCIGVGVGAVITDEAGRIFLAKRSANARNERGLWEFPGGAVKFNETFEVALKREVMEEFGVAIEVGPLLGVVDHILPEENQHWVAPTYLCEILSGVPAILEPEKCSEIGWFSHDDVPNDLTQVSRISFNQYECYVSA